MKDIRIWLNRLFAWFLIFAMLFGVSTTAYAAEIQMGKDGMLVFAPCELTIAVGDTVTFVNNELPPHNVMFTGHDLSLIHI